MVYFILSGTTEYSPWRPDTEKNMFELKNSYNCIAVVKTQTQTLLCLPPFQEKFYDGPT